MEASNLKIAIIGGGPGGLCTAIALHRKGFKNITVFERDQNTEARKQGYSFSLFAPVGGLAFLRNHGLFQDVEPHSCQVGMCLFDGDTGEALLNMPKNVWTSSPDADARRIMRGGLRNTLVNVCKREGIPIKWNVKYLEYEEKDSSVILKFENEPQYEADIVIAADGIHSKVRDQLIGDKELYTGLTAIFGLVYPQDNPELFQNSIINSQGAMFGGADKAFFFMHHHTQHHNELYWQFSKVIPEGEIRSKYGEDKAKLKQYVLDTLQGWEIPTKIASSTPVSGIDSILEYKDKTPLKVDSATGRACNSKSKRITLLGDAAHPMLPFQGAGCNNALIDVEKLTEQLSKLLTLNTVTTRDIDKALAIYEKEMTTRTAKMVLASREAAHNSHDPNKLHRMKRKVILRIVNWKLNTYANSKPLQWSFRIVGIGMLVLLLSWVVRFFI